jgi:predicted transcriptional regulator
VYAARAGADQTQRQLVRDLLDRAFGGSAAALVMQALATHPVSADELDAIQKLIAGHQRAGKSGGRK